MCVSMGPSEMSKTIVYAAEAVVEGEVVQVTGYQNRASSPGPNGMLLPFLTYQTMSQRNAIDMTACPKLLERMQFQLEPRTRSESDRATAGGVQAFDVGSYSVILAENPRDIARHLDLVPEAKRPAPNPALCEAYADLYPGHPVALCCWSGSVEVEPLMWWWKSKLQGRLFLTGMDAHNGAPPDLKATVERDHYLIWGSRDPDGRDDAWHYALDVPRHVRPFVPGRLRGKRISGLSRNGDWEVPAEYDRNAEPELF